MRTTMQCQHAPSDDPRFPNTCRKCALILPSGFIRSEDREKSLLARVTDDVALRDIAYRAVTDRMGVSRPWDNMVHRKFRRERMEELLDCIAYTFGEADQRLIFGYEDDLSTSDLLCLYHTVQALKHLLMPTDD